MMPKPPREGIGKKEKPWLKPGRSTTITIVALLILGQIKMPT
jgi:hypothetical protein